MHVYEVINKVNALEQKAEYIKSVLFDSNEVKTDDRVDCLLKEYQNVLDKRQELLNKNVEL